MISTIFYILQEALEIRIASKRLDYLFEKSRVHQDFRNVFKMLVSRPEHSAQRIERTEALANLL